MSSNKIFGDILMIEFICVNEIKTPVTNKIKSSSKLINKIEEMQMQIEKILILPLTLQRYTNLLFFDDILNLNYERIEYINFINYLDDFYLISNFLDCDFMKIYLYDIPLKNIDYDKFDRFVWLAINNAIPNGKLIEINYSLFKYIENKMFNYESMLVDPAKNIFCKNDENFLKLFYENSCISSYMTLTNQNLLEEYKNKIDELIGFKLFWVDNMIIAGSIVYSIVHNNSYDEKSNIDIWLIGTNTFSIKQILCNISEPHYSNFENNTCNIFLPNAKKKHIKIMCASYNNVFELLTNFDFDMDECKLAICNNKLVFNYNDYNNIFKKGALTKCSIINEKEKSEVTCYAKNNTWKCNELPDKLTSMNYNVVFLRTFNYCNFSSHEIIYADGTMNFINNEIYFTPNNQNNLLNDFIKDLQKKYKKKINCYENGFYVMKKIMNMIYVNGLPLEEFDLINEKIMFDCYYDEIQNIIVMDNINVHIICNIDIDGGRRAGGTGAARKKTGLK